MLYIYILLHVLINNVGIPVSHILFMNLDNYLQSSTFDSEAINVASVIYSIQVGDNSNVSQLLNVYPLSLDFTFDQVRIHSSLLILYEKISIILYFTHSF